MNINLSSVLFLLIFVFNLSCHQTSRDSVGLLLPNLTKARYPIDRDSYVKRAGELGLQVYVEDANNDDHLQIEQAKKLMDNGVSALVIIAVNKYTAAVIAREAQKKKIKVIAYERLIFNCKLDCYITFDHYKIGKQMTESVLKVKQTGNFVILSGDKSDNNAIKLYQGVSEVIDPLVSSKKINLLFNTFIEEWSDETAYITMQKIIKYSTSPIDAIISASDGIAMGAIKALNEQNMAGNVIVTGMNGELLACKNIIAGKQFLTMYKPIHKQGTLAAEVTYKLLKNEPLDFTAHTDNGLMEVPTVLLDAIEVNLNNLKQTIIDEKVYTEEQLK